MTKKSQFYYPFLICQRHSNKSPKIPKSPVSLFRSCACFFFIFCFLLVCNLVSHSLFIYLGFYVAFDTVQVISQRVVGRAEETSTNSSSGFCTVNCRPTGSNYQLFHLRPCREPNPVLRGGIRECYHSATVAPNVAFNIMYRLYHNR